MNRSCSASRIAPLDRPGQSLPAASPERRPDAGRTRLNSPELSVAAGRGLDAAWRIQRPKRKSSAAGWCSWVEPVHHKPAPAAHSRSRRRTLRARSDRSCLGSPTAAPLPMTPRSLLDEGERPVSPCVVNTDRFAPPTAPVTNTNKLFRHRDDICSLWKARHSVTRPVAKVAAISRPQQEKDIATPERLRMRITPLPPDAVASAGRRDTPLDEQPFDGSADYAIPDEHTGTGMPFQTPHSCWTDESPASDHERAGSRPAFIRATSLAQNWTGAL